MLLGVAVDFHSFCSALSRITGRGSGSLRVAPCAEGVSGCWTKSHVRPRNDRNPQGAPWRP